jgi:hypothetical protein
MPTPVTQDEAFQSLFEPEVAATRTLLEGPGRKMFLIAVALGDTWTPEDGMHCSLVRSISSGTTDRQCLGYIETLEREIKRVKALLENRA